MGKAPNEEKPDASRYRALKSKRSRERSRTVRDVRVYFNGPVGKEGAGLEDPKEGLRNLEHVSKVRFDPSGNVVAVSLEESQVEQEGDRARCRGRRLRGFEALGKDYLYRGAEPLSYLKVFR